MPSLYLLEGEEGPLKDEVLHSLLEERLPLENGDLDLEILDGRETGADEILCRAATLPFLASCRVIVVREADRLTSSDKERIVDYLKRHPSPHACFILLTKKIDRRGSFFQSLQKMGKVISCTISGPQEVQDWLQDRARKKGKMLTPSALQALYESVGDDLSLLVGELEKIILLVGERKEIQVEDVLAQGGKRMHHIFEVIDALGYGKVDEALRGVRSLLEYGEEPLSILGMISRHFRLLSVAKEMDSQGKSPPEIGRRLKIPGSYLQSLLSHASSVPWSFIEKVFQDLFQADLLLKSEKGLGTLALERLILDLSRAESHLGT